MTKVNVSLSPEILNELDKSAREANISRSAFIAMAVRRYLEEKETQRRDRGRRAAATMDRIRERFGGWDGTAEVLKWRELDEDIGITAL